MLGSTRETQLKYSAPPSFSSSSMLYESLVFLYTGKFQLLEQRNSAKTQRMEEYKAIQQMEARLAEQTGKGEALERKIDAQSAEHS